MVVYRFRLADIFGAVDWLQLSARIKRLANAVSFLPGNREESRTKERCRRNAVGSRKRLHPAFRKIKGPQALLQEVFPLDQVEHDKSGAENYRRENPFPRLGFVTSARG